MKNMILIAAGIGTVIAIAAAVIYRRRKESIY